MDEILRLSLLETYCLPVLTYTAPVIKLKACQLHELNCCWNSVYHKVFSFHRWESVRVFINRLGRLDFEHIMLLRRCRWLCKIRFTANSLVQNLFWVNTVDTRNTFALFALSSYSDAVKQITRTFVDTCVV